MKQNEIVLKVEDCFCFKINITKDKNNKYNVNINEMIAVSIPTSIVRFINCFVSYHTLKEDINIIKTIISDYLNKNRFKDINYPELCDIIAENIDQLCLFSYIKEIPMNTSNVKLIYNDKFTHHTRKYYFGKLEYDKKEMIKNNYKK